MASTLVHTTESRMRPRQTRDWDLIAEASLTGLPVIPPARVLWAEDVPEPDAIDYYERMVWRTEYNCAFVRRLLAARFPGYAAGLEAAIHVSRAVACRGGAAG